MSDALVLEKTNLQIKVLLVLVLLSISVLMVVYQTVYPLTLTSSEGYLTQIPVLYWILVSTIILLLVTINYISDSAIVSLVSTIIFYFVYSLYQFFYSHLFGGDINFGELHVMQQNTTFSPSTHFSYLEFPFFWFFHRIMYLIPFNQVEIITGIERGFAVIIFLFSISVWAFMYSNTGISQYAFYGSVFFVAVSHTFWNFQYVPQFFAFVILIVLFTVHPKSGKHWFGIKVLLFAALVFSHPMFFIFYLASVLLYPIVKSVWTAFDSIESNYNSVLILSISDALGSFPTFFRSYVNNLRSDFTDRRWMYFASVLLLTYLISFLYRQLSFQTSLIIVLQRSTQGGTAEFIDRFVPFISIEYPGSMNSEEVPRELLYHLTSEQISSFTTSATIGLILTGGLLLVLLLLVRKRKHISPFNITILLVAGGYFTVGTVMNILGNRALQVVFVPLVLSLTAVKDLERRKQIAVGSVIILVLLASPVAIANMNNNAELVGGHSTGDYYTEQAGLWIEDKEWETIVQPRRTVYPLNTHENRLHMDIGTLTSHNGGTNNVSEGSLVQFDWRMYHNTQYRAHTCNFDEQNIIYDNTNKILHVHEEFRCEPNR